MWIEFSDCIHCHNENGQIKIENMQSACHYVVKITEIEDEKLFRFNVKSADKCWFFDCIRSRSRHLQLTLSPDHFLRSFLFIYVCIFYRLIPSPRETIITFNWAFLKWSLPPIRNTCERRAQRRRIFSATIATPKEKRNRKLKTAKRVELSNHCNYSVASNMYIVQCLIWLFVFFSISSHCFLGSVSNILFSFNFDLCRISVDEMLIFPGQKIVFGNSEFRLFAFLSVSHTMEFRAIRKFSSINFCARRKWKWTINEEWKWVDDMKVTRRRDVMHTDRNCIHIRPNERKKKATKTNWCRFLTVSAFIFLHFIANEQFVVWACVHTFFRTFSLSWLIASFHFSSLLHFMRRCRLYRTGYRVNWQRKMIASFGRVSYRSILLFFFNDQLLVLFYFIQFSCTAQRNNCM